MVDTDHQVIVATGLNNTGVDVQQLVPMLEKTREINRSLGGQFLAAADYCSAGNLEHVASLTETVAGRSEFFIATGRLKHGEQVPDAPRGRIPAHATGRERMAGN